MRFFWCGVCVLIGLMMNQAFAAPPLSLSPKVTIAELLPHTEYFEDSGRQLTISDFLEGEHQFTFKSESFLNLGFSKSNHWFRFSANNQTEDIHRYLEIGGSISREVNVFAKENGKYKLQKKMKWSIANRYQLIFEPGKTTTIYFQIYDPQGAAIVAASLSDASAAIDSISFRNAFYAFLMSGLLVLAAYNFLYYLHLRDTAFLTLSVFIIGVALAMGNNEGLLNFFPWIGNNVGWLGASFLFIVILSGLRLGVSLLDVHQELPKMLIWYDAGSALGFILMVVALTYGYGLPLGGFMGLYGISLVLVTFFKLHKKNYTLPKSLLAAMLIFFISCLPIILTMIGVMEYYPPTTNWVFIATLVALLIMSLTQAEKIRLKSKYLERTSAANQAKDEFLTTMSHELRTPMNAVVGAGRLLKLSSLSKEQTEYVNRLNDSSTHMLSLVNDLLDLARVDHQLLQLESTPFKIEETLSTLKQLLEEAAKKKQLDLHLENHFLPLNKQLVGDPTRLNQVLLNLVGNAIKFTDTGKVSLTITPVEVNPDQASLHFAVNDTGVGLTEVQRNRLFQPFSQAESSTNRQYGGSGLGLAISQKLVKRMGGNLKVSSVYRQGSSFSFTLGFPLASNNLKSVKEEPSLIENLHGFKVLLVDDDEMNRFFGQKLLEACDVDVAVAESGETAIKLMQQQVFNLVFMDVSMPKVDGYETTRRVRQLSELKSVIIVALTAHAIAGERERCIEAGMDDYLTKPFELDDLRTMMVKWLVKSRKNVRLN